MAAPLHQLAKKDVPFTWGEQQEAAFAQLKEALTTAPILVHFDSSKDVELHPDASNYAIGTVVLQRDGVRDRICDSTTVWG